MINKDNYITYDNLVGMTRNERILVMRDDHMRNRTKSLFYEYRHPGYPYIFTLKDYDIVLENGDIIKSFKQIYLSLNDPTEHRIATEVLTSLDHWRQFTKSSWIGPAIDSYREELEIKLRCEAIEHVSRQAADSTSAAQFLAQGKWKVQRGRPSNEEKERALKIETRIEDEVEELYSRAIN